MALGSQDHRSTLIITSKHFRKNGETMTAIHDGSQECGDRKEEAFTATGLAKGSYEVNICTNLVGHRPPHMDKNTGRTWQ